MEEEPGRIQQKSQEIGAQIAGDYDGRIKAQSTKTGRRMNNEGRGGNFTHFQPITEISFLCEVAPSHSASLNDALHSLFILSVP